MRQSGVSTEKMDSAVEEKTDNREKIFGQDNKGSDSPVTETACRETVERFHSTDLSIRYWDESIFFESCREWTDLLNTSNCDHLFMSWEWHRAWWQDHKTDQSVLCVIAVYEAGVLLALAPMYLEKSSYIKGIVPVRRLQFIGKRFRGFSGIRGEYLNFIVRTDRSEAALPVLIEAICRDRRWDELVFEDSSIDENSYSLLASALTAMGCRRRLDGREPTYVIDCTTSFEDYLSSLGRNTRLRLYNRRKLLEQMGTVSLVPLTEANKPEFFATFNEFHQQRWGIPHFPHQAQQFLASVFSLEPSEMSLARSSFLKLDDRPVSVMLNAMVNSRIYNLQLGYVEDFDKRISIGTLHLGYQIENAFNDTAVTQFDFLAGPGKNTNYKSQLAKEYTTLLSIRWCRSFLLRRLFGMLDGFRRIFPKAKLN